MDFRKEKKNKNKTQGSSHFKPSSQVKGLRFGGQLIVKSFTIRRSSPLELLRLLSLPPTLSLPSTTSYIPTNFTILAHHAWQTLTLGLGTKKSKVVIFVFESEPLKSVADMKWPTIVPLGQMNKMIRCLNGCEMARFKFRKGCLTFYVYGVRRVGGVNGFLCSDDLKRVLEAVVELNDFLDHTAMLALPSQRSITLKQYPVAKAH